MASWSELSGGARAGLVALGVAAVALAGTLGWRANQPAGVTGDGPGAVDVSGPAPAVAEADTASAPPVTPADTAAVPESAPLAEGQSPFAPSFDNWRVEADGSAVVSGRAEPGAGVAVLIDGQSVAQTRAAGSGAFALLFTLAPNDKPSVMVLESTLADGSRLLSDQTIALAPIPGPDAAEAAGADPSVPPAAVVVSDDMVSVVQSGTAPVQAEDAAAEGVAQSDTVASAATDAAVAAVLIDAISYTAAGDVLVSGKGQGGQVVRIYLDNRLTASTPVAQGGAWQVTLADAAPGLYTLRADQIGADGKVSARFETPFQRETRERLAALAQNAPDASAPEAAAADPTAPDEGASSAGAPPTPQDPAAHQTMSGATDGTEGLTDVGASVPEPEETATATVAAAAETVDAPATAAITAVTEGPAKPAPAASEPAAAQSAPLVAAPAVPSQPDLAPSAPQPAPSLTADAAPDAASAHGAVAQPGSEIAPAPVPATVSITVQPGYTLWGIARDSLGDGVLYVQVYNANKDKIKNPDLIYPGQVFTVPVQE